MKHIGGWNRCKIDQSIPVANKTQRKKKLKQQQQQQQQQQHTNTAAERHLRIKHTHVCMRPDFQDPFYSFQTQQPCRFGGRQMHQVDQGLIVVSAPGPIRRHQRVQAVHATNTAYQIISVHHLVPQFKTQRVGTDGTHRTRTNPFAQQHLIGAVSNRGRTFRQRWVHQERGTGGRQQHLGR